MSPPAMAPGTPCPAAKKGRVSLTWKTRLRKDASNVQVQHSLVAVYGLLKRKLSCPSGSSLEQICLRKTSKPSSNKTLGITEALLPSKPCYISKAPATYAEKRRTSSATSFIPRNHLPSKLRYRCIRTNRLPAPILVPRGRRLDHLQNNLFINAIPVGPARTISTTEG